MTDAITTPAGTPPIIRMEGVNKWFDSFQVLTDIDLSVRAGERIVICGPSGSGKSTLIRCINRLEAVQKGRIEVGADADLVAFAPEAAFTASADALLHKNKVSAFDGSELTGLVAVTWLAGVPVYTSGAVDDAPASTPTGRLLSRV